MTILFDATKKTSRTTTRKFAAGLYASRVYRPTQAEAAEVLAWTAAEESARAAAERAAFQANRRIDRRAVESQALARLQAGLCF